MLTGDSSLLSGVVVRSLDKSQSQRYQAVGDLLDDVRHATEPATQATSQPDASIAVLPFDDMSPGKDQDYFCEGMAEEIIGALTDVDGLRVASRTSTFNARASILPAHARLGWCSTRCSAGSSRFKATTCCRSPGAIQRDPPPVLTGDSSLLSGVVVRSLDKSQSQRYQAVGDLLDDVRHATEPATQATSQPDASIAVLPFDDMSPGKDQDYFCEGMAEEIIGALTDVDGLRVASRTSTFNARASKRCRKWAIQPRNN